MLGKSQKCGICGCKAPIAKTYTYRNYGGGGIRGWARRFGVCAACEAKLAKAAERRTRKIDMNAGGTQTDANQ